MKTAEEMLQKAKNNDNGFGDKEIIQLMKEYAQSVAQQALENATGSTVNLCLGGHVSYEEVEKSITNPDNIPLTI